MWGSEHTAFRSKHLFLISCVRIARHHLSLSIELGTWGNTYTGISGFWIPSKHTGKVNQDGHISSSLKWECQKLRWVPHWKLQLLGFCPHRLMVMDRSIGRQDLPHWFLSTDFSVPMSWLLASFICWRHSKCWVMCAWKGAIFSQKTRKLQLVQLDLRAQISRIWEMCCWGGNSASCYWQVMLNMFNDNVVLTAPGLQAALNQQLCFFCACKK